MNTQEIQIRIFTFGQFTVERRSIHGVWEEVPIREWNGYRSPQSLLGYLLCSPKRFATRASLLRNLGSFKGDPDKAVSNAASLVRKVCPPSILQTLGGRHNNSYQLADQSIVWADCDACLALTKTPEQQGKTVIEKQAFLEQAIALLQRGPFLEDEDGLWCYGVRGMWEKKYYQCRLQLAEIYEQQQQFDQAEMLYSTLLAENMQDEMALCRLMSLLVQQSMPHLARKRYEEVKAYLHKDQLILSPTTEAFFEKLQNKVQLLNENGRGIPLTQKPMPTVLSIQPLSLGSPEQPQDIIRQIQEPGDQHMDTVRRQLLQTGMRAAEVAPFVPLLEYLDSSILERFSQALKGPSRLDEATFQYFAICTQQHWHCRQSAAFSSRDLYCPVNHHFQKMISQLESPLLPAERKRICTLLCQTAQLLGELALDMGSYEHGRMWHQAGLLAAQEAEDAFLEVVAWGRISLTWIYSKIMPDALSCVQKARSLANKHGTPMVRGWLAAIEAEIQAHLGQPEICLQSLADAECFDQQSPTPLENYLIHFDCTLLGGYQGVCFRLLARPEQTQSQIFLQKAQDVLRSSLAALDPLFIQRRPTLLADLASVAISQHNIEEGCELISQAAALATQMHLQKVLQRLVSFRDQLQPWEESASVKAADAHLAFLSSQLNTPV